MCLYNVENLIRSKKEELDNIAKDIATFIRNKKTWSACQYGTGVPSGIINQIAEKSTNINNIIDKYEFFQWKKVHTICFKETNLEFEEYTFDDICLSVNNKVKEIIDIVKKFYCTELVEDIKEIVNKIVRRLEKLDTDKKFNEKIDEIFENLSHLTISRFIQEHSEFNQVKELYSFIEYIEFNDITYQKDFNLFNICGLIEIFKLFKLYLKQIDTRDLSKQIYTAIIEYICSTEIVEKLLEE